MNQTEYAQCLTSAGGGLTSLGHNLSLTTCTCIVIKLNNYGDLSRECTSSWLYNWFEWFVVEMNVLNFMR